MIQRRFVRSDSVACKVITNLVLVPRDPCGLAKAGAQEIKRELLTAVKEVIRRITFSIQQTNNV